MLITITAACSLTMKEIDEIGNTVRDFMDDDALVVMGVRHDLEMKDELRVTIVATGLDDRLISAIGRDAIEREKEIRWNLEAFSTTDNSLSDYQDIPAFLRRPTG